MEGHIKGAAFAAEKGGAQMIPTVPDACSLMTCLVEVSRHGVLSATYRALQGTRFYFFWPPLYIVGFFVGLSASRGRIASRKHLFAATETTHPMHDSIHTYVTDEVDG